MAEATAAPTTGAGTHISIRDTVSSRRLIFVLIGVVLGMLLSALDGTIVGTAMPTIIADLGGLSHYAWVFTAYMLASTVTVPIYGKLSDIYGRRFFFIMAMVIFLAGSALSGLSQNMTELIIFRAIQGLGAGGLMPLAMATIGDVFPPAQRAKWGAGLTAIFGLATIIGPSLGGIITDNLGWQWVFYVNMPIGALAIVTTSIAMPAHTRRQSHTIDYRGVGALIAWSVPLLLAFSLGGNDFRWGSWQIIGMIVFAVLMLGVFLRTEARAKEPVLSLAFFKNPIFTVSMIVTFLTSMGMFGAISYLPLFVQGVVGSSATNAGAVLTPMMLGFIVSSMISGQILARTGRYKVIALVGFAIGAAGLFLLAGMDVHATNAIVVQRMVLTGLGIGVSMSLFTIIVQNAVPLAQMGAATAALTFFRSIGGTVGLALLGSVMTNRFNSAFDKNLPDTLKQRLPPAQLTALRNPQVLLSHDATTKIHDSFGAFGAQGDVLFGQLMLAIRQSLTTAITSLFAVAAIAMVLAFVAVIFLKEIPLRKSNRAEAKEGAESIVSAAPVSAPAATAPALIAAADRAEQSAVATLPTAAMAPIAATINRPPGIPVEEHPASPAAFAMPEPLLPTAATASAVYVTGDTDAERVIAALEQFIRQQIGVTHQAYDALTARIALLEQTTAEPTALLEEDTSRLEALEQSVAALDRFARSMPPARWHRAHDARTAALEQRLAALEQLCAHLAAGTHPDGDGRYAPRGADAYAYAED